MNYFDIEHIEKIRKLNSSYIHDKKLDRLRFIYDFSRNKFEENLKRYEDYKVKYILFGEAPPWTEIDNPRYFYSKIESKLHETFWKTFNSDSIPTDMSSAYQRLAKEKFLLIDTIPYALKYSPRIRKKEIYSNLIFEYLTNQLNIINDKIELEKELKIAFAFKLNGIAIIKSFGNTIKIGKQSIELNEENIAADRTGFPKPHSLKKIFEII